jgi:hypothetical protein
MWVALEILWAFQRDEEQHLLGFGLGTYIHVLG